MIAAGVAAGVAAAVATLLVPSLASVLEGERVLLVADDPQSELALRIHDELIADGFDVVVRDPFAAIDLLRTARELSASVALEIRSGRVDLWHDAGDGKIDHAVMNGVAVDKDVVAVRVAELVRARMLSPRAHPPPGPAPVKNVDATPHGTSFELHSVGAVGARGELAFAGLPLRAGVDASLGVLVDPLEVGVVVEAPILAARIDRKDGSADVSVTRVDGRVAWHAPRLVDDLDASVAVAAGVAWIHGSGRGKQGQPARDGDLAVADVAASVAVSYVVAVPLALLAALEIGAFAPTPVLIVGADDVAAGPGYAAFTAGISFSY